MVTGGHLNHVCIYFRNLLLFEASMLSLKWPLLHLSVSPCSPPPVCLFLLSQCPPTFIHKGHHLIMHWVWRLSADEPDVSSSRFFPGCSQTDMGSKQVEWASRAAEGKREETVCSTSELGNTGPFLHMPMTVRHYGFQYPKEKSFKSDSLAQSQRQ